MNSVQDYASLTKSAQPQAPLPPLRSQSRQAMQEELLLAFQNHCRNWIFVRDGKVWIIKRRCHHGLLGAGFVVAGAVTKQPALMLVGAYLCWDDKEDWPWQPNRL